jgi:hypothetical protein
MNINDFEVVCINLDSRRDRWLESCEEFVKAKISPYRYPALKDSNPINGCALSHFDILEHATKNVMIFEDDVKFINSYSHLDEYLLSLDSLQSWDMLYLGGNICGSIYRINDKIGRLTHAQSTHAYCVNKQFIPKILEKKNLLGKHLDLIYAEDIIPYNDCYITIPMLAIQRPSYSDIEKKQVDYSWMEDRYYQNLS